MLVSKSNFKNAAAVCTDRFMKFAHAYGRYQNAISAVERFEGGLVNFNTVELNDPKEDLNARLRGTLHEAMNKLSTLDIEYFRIEKRHIFDSSRTYSYDEMTSILETIATFAG